MRLVIDASNIRGGGGVTHLVELLRAANPAVHGFDQVVVWASQATLARLEDRPWLVKRTDPLLESHYLRRALWQRNRLGGTGESGGMRPALCPRRLVRDRLSARGHHEPQPAALRVAGTDALWRVDVQPQIGTVAMVAVTFVSAGRRHDFLDPVRARRCLESHRATIRSNRDHPPWH